MQVFFLSAYTSVNAGEVVAIIKNIVPHGLALPFRGMLTDDFVIAGAIELGADDWDAISVTNTIKYVSSRVDSTPVSEMHFLPPGYHKDCNRTIHGALATLIRSVRKRRYAQLDKSQRKVSMAGCYGSLDAHLAGWLAAD